MAAEYDRAVEATDPLGATERLEFRYIDAPVPASLPAEQVPPAFQGRNTALNQVVSLHWKKGTTFSDVAQATQLRWMIYSQDIFADPGWAIGVLHSKQEPGEARVWYDYASESGNGASAVPTAIGRQLPDGTTHQVWRTRNRQDRITRELDAAGRDTTYTYAANGIDLLEVRNVTGGRNDPAPTACGSRPSIRSASITRSRSPIQMAKSLFRLHGFRWVGRSIKT